MASKFPDNMHFPKQVIYNFKLKEWGKQKDETKTNSCWKDDKI
jgi:hypothetical protein